MLMLRQAATMVVRLGFVLLLLAVLVRVLPAPSPADAVADDMGLVISGAVVAVGGAYLLLTRDAAARRRPSVDGDGSGPEPGRGELAAGGRER